MRLEFRRLGTWGSSEAGRLLWFGGLGVISQKDASRFLVRCGARSFTHNNARLHANDSNNAARTTKYCYNNSLENQLVDFHRDVLLFFLLYPLIFMFI